ncbi:MAG: hypothetical protein R3F56_19725 [Planctomycetota bacterium]
MKTCLALRSLASLSLLPSLLSAAPGGGEPALTVYGTGTPGSGGFVPTLWANSTPRPGHAGFAWQLERGLGGSIGAGFVAPARVDLPIAGLRILVDTSSAVALPPLPLNGSGAGGGSLTVPLPLPNLSLLLGAELHGQVFVADPAGAFVGVAATPGLTMRPKRPGMLVATRSVGGSPDAQVVIELATGTVRTFGGGAVDNGDGVTFTPRGTHLLVCGGLTRAVSVFDAATGPVPQHLFDMPSPAGTSPWNVHMHPDGRRAYVVNQGPSTTTPLVEVFDADPSSSNFGQPFPGGGFDPMSISALRMEFDPNGDSGYLANLGIGGTPGVFKYDTRTGSSTYHQQVGALPLSGQFVWDEVMSCDGSVLYLAAGPLGGNTEVNLVDPATMTRIDWDPGAPGVQNIGGEVSFGPTPTGRVINSLAVDPRHRYLYFAVAGGSFNPTMLVQVDVDPTSSNYRQSRTYTTGLPLGQLGGIALTDAGELLYLAVRDGSAVHEIDTATLTQVRTFAVPSAPGFVALR